MEDRRRKQIGLAAASASISAIFAICTALLFGELALAIFGVISGAILIALIVNFCNGHGDPRRGKRPRDTR